MGIEDEADRTLFIRNLDSKVTEELLFELFLQAGPLVRTKIPKDAEGKQKSFGFVLFKHEVSVPYGMQLLNGTMLHGKNIHVQFRSGSSHCNSPGNAQHSKPENTPNTHGHRLPVQFSSPQQMLGSFSSPDNLQKQIMTNNMLGMLQVQQLQSVYGGLSVPQHSSSGHSSRSSSRQHDGSPYRQHPSGRYGRDGHHHQNERAGYRHHDDRGGNRHYDDWGGKRSYQDRWHR